MVDNGGQPVHTVPNPSYSSSVRPMNPSPAYTSGSASITNTQVVSRYPFHRVCGSHKKKPPIKTEPLKLSTSFKYQNIAKALL